VWPSSKLEPDFHTWPYDDHHDPESIKDFALKYIDPSSGRLRTQFELDNEYNAALEKHLNERAKTPAF